MLETADEVTEPGIGPVVHASKPQTLDKYLCKNNFIFIPEILEYIFDVVKQMPPTFIGIEFDPLILHKAPQYLNTIQFGSIFWKIKDIEAFLVP